MYPCIRPKEEARKGWKTYGKNVCYGIEGGKLCWYCGLGDKALKGKEIVSFSSLLDTGNKVSL